MPQEFTVDPQGNTQPVNDTGGYINTSSPMQTNFQAEEQERGFDSLQQVEELQQKLGVNLNDLQPQQQQQPEVQPPQQPQDDIFNRFNSAEGKRMRDEFKKIMGIDPMEAFQAVQNTQAQLQQIDQWRKQVVVEREMDTLRQEWGNEFDATFSEVRSRYEQLPDHMKSALDNLDGARLLAAQIRSERINGVQSGTSLPRSSGVSRTQSIRTTGAPSGFVRTSDYLNDHVSEADYLAAVRAGRVIRDF
jgi:hypothetical protein